MAAATVVPRLAEDGPDAPRDTAGHTAAGVAAPPSPQLKHAMHDAMLPPAHNGHHHAGLSHAPSHAHAVHQPRPQSALSAGKKRPGTSSGKVRFGDATTVVIPARDVESRTVERAEGAIAVEWTPPAAPVA